MDSISPQRHIMVLGIGCVLLSDEGFGVKVVHALHRRYDFPANVELMDGATLGVNLLGYISQVDDLIVVDAIRNGGTPGTLYRLDGDEVPERIRAKNSLHQVDFLETLTLCQALEKVPDTVIIGVEPEDIDTCSIALTPALQNSFRPAIEMVLAELERLGVSYTARTEGADDVPCDPITNRLY
jgi:hydrogenase maturation protease